jgi:hypothetical protein
MPLEREDRDERIARIDMLLEELRLNSADLTELAKQATERCRLTRAESGLLVSVSREMLAAKKR